MSSLKIIRDGAIINDDWTLVAVDHDAALPNGKLIVPLKVWLLRKIELLARAEPIGVWLDGHDDVSTLADSVDQLSLIAINFPKFADGRGYSAAALLRTRYGFKGELRAIGDVLRDQLFYMQRVGFNAFAVRADKDIVDALKALTDFSETYQASTDQPVPLFRRRTHPASESLS